MLSHPFRGPGLDWMFPADFPKNYPILLASSHKESTLRINGYDLFFYFVSEVAPRIPARDHVPDFHCPRVAGGKHLRAVGAQYHRANSLATIMVHECAKKGIDGLHCLGEHVAQLRAWFAQGIGRTEIWQCTHCASLRQLLPPLLNVARGELIPGLFLLSLRHQSILLCNLTLVIELPAKEAPKRHQNP